MDIRINSSNDRILIAINGEIDEQGAELLEKNYRGISKTGIREIEIDFKGVTHIGSAGIGRLLLIYKDSAVAGITARITHVSATIHNLLKMVKLDTIFKIET